MADKLQQPLTDVALKELVQFSNSWALTHGIVVRAARDTDDVVTYAPHTLFPSPVPQTLFKKTQELQPSFNELMWKVTQDEAFLTSVLKTTITVDDFTARLFRIYKQVMKEGCRKPVTLALLRSDYMLDTKQGKDTAIKQVEINTIASSLAGLSTRITSLHRATIQEHNISNSTSHLPDNTCLDGLAEGFIKAWELYEQPRSVILFVVADGESNVYDITHHLHRIKQLNSSVTVVMRDLKYLGENSHLTDDKRLMVDDTEVAIVYYRIGYIPEHFPTEKSWNFKLIAEQSKSAVCPAIDWHLAGTKKVQQELSRPGVLERYLDDPEVIAAIRSTFAGMYPLDLTEEGDKAAAMGIANPQDYVMKPQREGGGHNVYGDDVGVKLRELSGQEERSAYILMERILPMVVKNYELRNGLPVAKADMVSEIGTYGVLVCKDDTVIVNKVAGHLLRTKNIAKDEGGIASGAAVLDSPFLI